MGRGRGRAGADEAGRFSTLVSSLVSARPKTILAALETEREGAGLLRSAVSAKPLPRTMLPDLEFAFELDLETSRKRPKTERGRSAVAVLVAAGTFSALVGSLLTVCKPVGVIGREDDLGFSTVGLEGLLAGVSRVRVAGAKAGAIVRGEETERWA
jgi:hypothetical protein